MKDQFGFVKVQRTLVDWEWYTDVNTCQLFLHCLIKANYSDKKWRGIFIRRGEFITSLEKLAVETGLSISKVRTAINKLESTGDLKTEPSTQFTRVIVNSEYFDSNDLKSASKTRIRKPNNNQDSNAGCKQIASEQQANDNQLATTNNKQEEIKENKKEKFKTDVFLHSQFSDKILNSFFNYWSELNKNGQMRFEGETYWETKKRLQKWASNEKQSKNKQQSITRASLNR